MKIIPVMALVFTFFVSAISVAEESCQERSVRRVKAIAEKAFKDTLKLGSPSDKSTYDEVKAGDITISSIQMRFESGVVAGTFVCSEPRGTYSVHAVDINGASGVISEGKFNPK